MADACAAPGGPRLASLPETLTPSCPCCGPSIPRPLAPNPPTLRKLPSTVGLLTPAQGDLARPSYYHPCRMGEALPTYNPPRAHHRCAATSPSPLGAALPRCRQPMSSLGVCVPHLCWKSLGTLYTRTKAVESLSCAGWVCPPTGM